LWLWHPYDDLKSLRQQEAAPQELEVLLNALIPLHRVEPEHLQRIERVLLAAARLTSARIGGPITDASLTLDVKTYPEQLWSANGKTGSERRAT
jgi:hypothetical protein